MRARLRRLARPVVVRTGCVLLLAERAGHDPRRGLVAEVAAWLFPDEISAEAARLQVERYGTGGLGALVLVTAGGREEGL